MVLGYISNGLRQARKGIGYFTPFLLALAIACSRGEVAPTRVPSLTSTPPQSEQVYQTPTPSASSTIIVTPESGTEYFLRKYTVIPDERRLTGYMSRENIRKAVETHIKRVVVTDLYGNKESVDVGLFADSLSNASFNFLSTRGLEATFNHAESGECTEMMERFDFNPPLNYSPIGRQTTGFLSKIKCEREWKSTQTQWSNAAPLESFFTYINGARAWHDLIFNDGMQFISPSDDINKTYWIDSPKTR